MYILDSKPMLLNLQTQTEKLKSFIATETPSTKVTMTRPIDKFIMPKLQDSLFWCLFIATNGYDEFLQVNRNYGVKELEIKKKVADLVKEKPNLFKFTNQKVTKVSIQEILSELLTSQKETSTLCLIAMTIYYNVNIILINSTKQFMIEFISNKDVELPTYVFQKNDKRFAVNIDQVTKETILDMKESMVCLENYIKPLKPMSTYKVEDLIKLATKIGVYNQDEKLKKPDLYEKLSEAMKWK
jgi:hypothetical protein